MMLPHLKRPNLSEDVAFAIRERIYDGRLRAGEHLVEGQLAESLGVSRTPVREALAMLAAERAVRSAPRRGYFVRELSLEEAGQIYPIRALLDPEALRLSGIPSKERLARLQLLNDTLRRQETVVEAIRCDEAWHRELWGGCPNRELVELIEHYIARTRRYELFSMGQRKTIRRTTATKKEILDNLRRGRLDAACGRLRESLTAGGSDVFERLERARAERTQGARE